MVELDIKEDGEAVTLDDLMAKIANEEEVGDITVNGHASTTEQIAQIQSVKTALEVAKMLAQDVEITDEHVENLESLIQGISDGTVDINSAIQSGTLSVEKQTGSMKSQNDGQEGQESDDFPATKTSTGEVLADADGNYTAPLISDSTYNGSYNFKLNDPANKTYYTDSNYEGIVTDGVISLSCADTATAGGRVTVTATLNKAQKVPVSFDWSAAGAAISEAQSGSVAWEAGETGEKTFEITVTKPEGEYWYGDRAFVINTNLLLFRYRNNITYAEKLIIPIFT